MKKTLLTTILAATAVAGFAQGIVNFANDSGALTSPPDRLIRFAFGNTPGNAFGTNNAPAIGTNFQVQLYYGASTAPDSALIPVTSNPARLRGSTTTAAGTWSGGGGRTFVGFDVGASVKLQVRVWDIAFGSTWDAANVGGQHGVGGVSQSFVFLVPAATDVVGQAMSGFSGFSVNNVPEPTSLALTGLGIASLIAFRRRK